MKSGRAYELLHRNHLRKKMVLSTVSGVASTKIELVRLFDRDIEAVDIITTKSFQVKANPGNTPPVITSPSLGDFGNSVGLRNPGMDKAYPELEELRKEGMRALLNVSLSANDEEGFITLVKKFDPVADLLELNFSCPHAAKGYGASIGSDKETVRSFVKAICEAYPERKALLIIKLTPNVPDIADIAKAAIESGADGIAAINTVGPRQYLKDGHPILFNKLGGKGGASGAWVFDIALDAVRRIRERIGDDPIILGMGGVVSSSDARALLEAGADSIGIGSAIARVEPEDWGSYFSRIKNGEDVEPLLSPRHDNLEYERHVVVSKRMYDEDTVILTLDGKSSCKAGEFSFLWIPEVGERPFSVAKNDPLTFIIKIRGPFTAAAAKLEKGDVIYTRGLCGKGVENIHTGKALLLGGGTGVVVLNLLAEKLHSEGTLLDIRLGLPRLPDDGKGLMQEDLEKYGTYRIVADDGKPGRVLESYCASDVEGDVAAYVVGPSVMMRKAAEMFISFGLPADRIYISLEKMTMCGVGLCGECVCGNHLACKEGTFVTWRYILDNRVEL